MGIVSELHKGVPSSVRLPNKPIEQLMAEYTAEECNFTDIEWVKLASLRYVQTMEDCQVRCLLYALASLPSASGCTECEAWNLTCPKCGAAKGGECGWPTNCPTGQNKSATDSRSDR